VSNEVANPVTLELLKLNIKLHFAHSTFRWSNEGKGVAAVHCVIMGFVSCRNAINRVCFRDAINRVCFRDAINRVSTICRLFDYGDNIAGVPIEIQTKQINPYLVDAPTVLIDKRSKPLDLNAPKMTNGNKPTKGGHLFLSQEEADVISKVDPIAEKYIRRFLGSEEFINNLTRYCLWLKKSMAQDRKSSSEIQRRMEGLKAMRLASPKLPTKKLAETPYLFGEIRQTDQPYLAIPEVSSENRTYIPIGYSTNQLASNKLYMIPNANLYYFGTLTPDPQAFIIPRYLRSWRYP